MISRPTFLLAAGTGAVTTHPSLKAGEAKASEGAEMPAGGPASAPVKRQGLALALGGGAAKGFAHIPFLQALDELGVRPKQVAGTSMGAILGGLYCSGMSGRDIRAHTIDLFARRRLLLQKLLLNGGQTWSSVFNFYRPAVIDPEVLFAAVLPPVLPERFDQLEIPLKVVTCDFYRQSQYLITDGPLLSAIAASSALPVLLTPVRRDGRVLIDGGFVNPTPFDVLDADRFRTIGIDVTGPGRIDTGELPGSLQTWIGSFVITLHSIVAEKLKTKQPDLLVSPPVDGFRPMDFFDVEGILAAADGVKDDFKRTVAALMERT